MKAFPKGSIGEMMIDCIEELKSGGIENPARDVELMMTCALGESRSDLYSDRSKILPEEKRLLLIDYLKRRLAGEPVQYILGETEFYGLPFKIDRRALIPRPETESLVEKALEILKKMDNPSVLDIGTGSGAIAVALAVNCDCIVTAIDYSGEALTLAKENCILNNVDNKVRLLELDFLSDDFAERLGNKFDMIVSNPPYVAENEVSGLDICIKDFEPQSALTDNEDGLKFYRRMAEIVKDICKPGGWVLLEIASMRDSEVKEILRHSLENLQIFPDLTEKPRVAVGQCSLN